MAFVQFVFMSPGNSTWARSEKDTRLNISQTKQNLVTSDCSTADRIYTTKRRRWSSGFCSLLRRLVFGVPWTFFRTKLVLIAVDLRAG